MAIYDEAKLVNIASGYKAATYYSVLPDDGSGDFDVARNSVATRVNSDLKLEEMAVHVPRISYDSGVTCPYCLLEPQRTNLLTYPVSFDNAYWTKSGASIQGDPTTAGSELNTTASACSDPNGNEADATTNFGELNLNGTGANVFESQGAVKNVGSYALHTDANDTPTNGARFYKDAETDWGLSAGNTYKVSFDARHIGTGGLWAIGLASSNAGITNEIASLTSTDNTFVTYTFYFDYDANHKYFVAREFESSNNGGIYLDNLSCTLVTGYSAPHADSPLDVSAFKLVESSGGTVHYTEVTSLTLSTGTDLSFSVIAKQAERKYLSLVFRANADNGIGVQYDLDTGIEEYNYETGAGYSITSTSITPLADGYYIITLTGKINHATAGPNISLSDDAWSSGTIETNTYSGTVGYGAYIAFAQLEEGSYPTSWIYDGTEGSTTTRVADAVTGAGDTTLFSSVNSSGVLYAEIAALSDDLSNRFISISDGSYNNSLRVGFSNTTNQIYGRYYLGGVIQATLAYSVTDETEFLKIGFRWAENDFSLWINGVERSTDVSGSIWSASTVDEVSFDRGDGNNLFYGKCREVSVFEYLDDSQMALLTT